MNRIMNEYIRGAAQAEQFEDRVVAERLKWFGQHIVYCEYTGQRVMEMELPGSRAKADQRESSWLQWRRRCMV